MVVTAPPGLSVGAQQFVLEREREGFQAVLQAIVQKIDEHDGNVTSFGVQMVSLQDSMDKYEKKVNDAAKFAAVSPRINAKLKHVQQLIDLYNVCPAQQRIATAFKTVDHLIQNTTSVPSSMLQRWFPRTARRSGQARSLFQGGIGQQILDNERTVAAIAQEVIRDVQELARLHQQIENEIGQAQQLIDGLRQLL